MSHLEYHPGIYRLIMKEKLGIYVRVSRRILASQGPQYRVGIICPPLVEIGLRWLPKLGKDQSLASLAAVAALY